MPELRFDPFREEFVVIASMRQERTFLPSEGACPLCPTRDGGFQTEVPVPCYDIAVFDNRFPAFDLETRGHCEVVCYSDDHCASLSTLGLAKVRRLIDVWADRTSKLYQLPGVRHVFVFENRGRDIGVTIDHPHGQIYALPFVPRSEGEREDREARFFRMHGRTLHEQWVEDETVDGQRLVWQDDHACVAVPSFARFPYECWVALKEAVPRLSDMTPAQARSLAHGTLEAARRIDALFSGPMPYLMAVRQASSEATPGATGLRVEFMTMRRSANKLKFLASSETAIGVFLNDVQPEAAAALLRAAVIAPVE